MCTPDCAGAACGDPNKCGGVCDGPCEQPGYTCIDGQCTCAPKSLGAACDDACPCPSGTSCARICHWSKPKMVYHPGGVHPETKQPMPGGWIEETEFFEAPCDIDDLAWFAGEEAWESGVRLLGMPQWICSQSVDVPPGALAETEGYPGGCAADCGPWGQCVLRCGLKGISQLPGGGSDKVYSVDQGNVACDADTLAAMALFSDDSAPYRDVVTNTSCGCRQAKDDQAALVWCSGA